MPLCLRLVRQPQRGQSDACNTEAEFLQRPAPRDGLGHALGQFIEFVVHNFSLCLVCPSFNPSVLATRTESGAEPETTAPGRFTTQQWGTATVTVEVRF